MRSQAMGICLLALAAIGGSGPTVAQDAVPETPPELRDFRLDEPRPAPQPQPQSQQTQPDPPAVQVLPPAVRTVPDQVREQPARASSNRPETRVREDARADEPTSNNDAEPLPSAATDDPVSSLPPIETAPAPDARADEPVEPAEVAPGTSNTALIFGIAGGVALLGLLAFLFCRRRQRPAPVAPAKEIQTPTAPAIPAPAPTRAAPPVVPRPSPQPLTPVSGNVSISFIPDKAIVSLVTLTVQGHLQISNEGTQIAKDMQLRSVLLSASNQQQLAIDSFFANPAQVEPNALGEAKPGERLGLSLELSVPLSEMQPFQLGDQRLLVPIVIATLTYADENGVVIDAKLACMIGREASPPQPKMGPLRLDKGPRSFAPLGQRPVYA